MHSPGFENNGGASVQTLLNADSLYVASFYALLLNIKLANSDYYRKKTALAPVTLVSVMFVLYKCSDPSILLAF